MKKALALVLSLLVAFSMFSVMAFAADSEANPPIRVVFYVDNEIVKDVYVHDGTILTPYAPANPTKADTDTTEYTFKGWQTEGDDNFYYQNTLPVAKLAEGETTKEIVYTAVFAEEDISGRQSFWNLVESIFARINLIFEYFATIFNW